MQKILESNEPIDSRTAQVLDLYVNAPVAINTFLGDTHIIDFVNPKMLELWGRKYEEVINKPLAEALPETQGQWFHETFSKIYREGTEFVGNEVPADLKRNGKIERAYFNVVYKPLRHQGEITGVVQVATEVTELVEARKKIEKSEELLRVAVDAGKMGTWQFDFVNRTITRSKLHDQIFGYCEGALEWNEQILYQHIHPDYASYVTDKFSESLKIGNLSFETPIYWNDKSLHWIQVNGKTTFDNTGQPLVMTGVVMDITERKKQAEKEVQLVAIRAAKEEAERQGAELRELFMNAPAMICTLNGPDHVYDLVNPLYQQLFPNRNLQGKKLMDALPELVGQPFKNILDEVFTTGKTFVGKEMEAMLDRFDSGIPQKAYITLVYQARRNFEGQIIGILVFAYDVTEQVLARKTIEENEENLRLALEAGKMGTWNYYLSKDELIRSEQYDRVFGYEKSLPTWHYQTLLDHIIPDDKERVSEGFSEFRESGALNLEARIIGGDKKIHWLAFIGKSFKETNDLRMAGVVIDITELKEAEQKAQELSKELATINEELSASNEELTAANEEIQSSMEELASTNAELYRINTDLDNFIYTASHDLKAPIANIEGLIRVVKDHLSPESKEKDKIKRTLPLIDASIDRFKKTINALTDIVKLQKEQQEEQLVNIGELVEEVRMDLATMISESNAVFEIDIPADPSIHFSYKNMKSIIYNLISNAIKYRSSKRTPVIKIGCYDEYGYIKFVIEDNGLGMDLKNEAKIFSMFKRLHNHVEGSGIGLYIVKKILENTGGKIEVTSKLDEGTTFHVYLKK